MALYKFHIATVIIIIINYLSDKTGSMLCCRWDISRADNSGRGL